MVAGSHGSIASAGAGTGTDVRWGPCRVDVTAASASATARRVDAVVRPHHGHEAAVAANTLPQSAHVVGCRGASGANSSDQPLEPVVGLLLPCPPVIARPLPKDRVIVR